MVFYLLQQSLVCKVLDHLFAGRKPVQPLVLLSRCIDHAGLVEDVDPIEIVPLPHLEIVEIVSRSDLDHAGTEFHIDVFVGNYRNLSVYQGKSTYPPISSV